VSRAVAYRHADWLSLVEPAGSFVTLPVLNRVFPNGLDRTDPVLRQQARERRPEDLSDPAAMTARVEWVLSELLSWGPRLRSGPQVPATLTQVVGEHNAVLRPDHVLVEPDGDRETVRALVCQWPAGTALDTKLPGERWSATPAERAAQLCRATGVPLALVTDGEQWRLVWAPVEATPGSATFLASLFSEEPAVLDAFVSLLSARRFFAVQAGDTIEALLAESAAAQEVVADQLGKQVRSAVELLVASISRANRERDGELLAGHSGSEIYEGTVTVLMRLVFLLFAEERGLLPLDDDLYARSYALSTLRDQLQAERDLHGEEPLERRSAAWYRILALFRAVHGGLTHDTLRIPPYGGRLFDPDRFPFLEGRGPGERWRTSAADPIPVDDLTMLAVLDSLQQLEFKEGSIKESRQLSYRTLEVEQIGHVYEGLLDHSIRKVDTVTLGLVGKAGDEPEVPLAELETAAAGGREPLVAWLKTTTGRTDKQLAKLLDTPPGENDRQLLAAAVDNDDALTDRLLPYVHLLRRDLRDLPIVMLDGSIYVTQTSTRREGGVEYTTKDLADEVARYALEPLVYSPGPQDGTPPEDWQLRPSAELLDLKICDPAVGSGAILVAAGRYLADRLVEAWVAEEADEAVGADDEVRLTARRAVADRCLYGVDRDPLAAEMAKLSLWLITMAKDRPFTFLDHAVRTGDALLGVTSLDQIRWMHLDPAAGRRLHQNLFDWTAALEPLVKDALERRRRLANIRVITVRDAEDKARLTAEADADLETLRVVADLVCGATISTATQKKSALDDRLLVAAQRVAAGLADGLDEDSRRTLLDKLKTTAAEWLNAGRPDTAPVRRNLHWPIEFPEVFLDREDPGFHFVGNPPFLHGQKISGSGGEDFRQYLVNWVAGGTKGSADLVAYFFLRATKVSTSLGFLATNTIAQGDTSEVGLAQLVDSGWSICRAVSSTPWPGRASLEIAKVWATAGVYRGTKHLDGAEVVGVDEMLCSVPRSGWRKHRLADNAEQSFIGSYVLGMGFTMPSHEAQAMIATDPRNAEVLFPFVGGEDLNKSPTHTPPRWIINFFDWEESKARAYVDCFAIVEQQVKPERQEKKPNGEFKKRKPLPQLWWIYGEKRPGLYAAIGSLERVLVLTLHSKHVLPVFVPRRQVFSHALAVFALDTDFSFGVLSSGFHYRWAVRHGSTLETRVRYTPSDVFETYPQPPESGRVSAAGKALNEHRAALMVAEDEGLTATYNRVHDPSDTTPGIVRLRELHKELDIAVRDAYGWSDLDLEHGFHPVRGQGVRYTFSPAAATEVLERLLELNMERYEAEVAKGLHGTAKKKAPARKKKAPAGAEALDLFGSMADDETEGQ
jgi:hypothetical protein